ncbi:MAG TPA: GtrA family protein [Acidimicrobiales bacterium]|nr:GtrA family protein [Acidimicrobiales bacterium]
MFSRLWDLRVKLLRYSGVSMIAIAVTQASLWIGLVIVDWPAIGANVFAVSVAAAPAYLLNRSWVWNRSDRHSIRDEVLPFWMYSLVGLAISSVLVGVADRWWSSTPIVMSANLVAYALLWVGKFFLLEKILFRRPRCDEK